MKRELRTHLIDLCREFGLLAIYAFGSRAEEAAAQLRGAKLPASSRRPRSDLDIGVQPARGHDLPAGDRVRLMQALEDVFDVGRVDLVILPEADVFLAADAVRGELLAATDLDEEALEQLYYLRRAADYAPYLRERYREIVGAEA